MNKRLIAMVLVLGMLLSCTGYATGEETAAPAPRNAAEDLLLIVDFQNVYLPGYDWACPDMPEAMANTISILIDPEAPGAAKMMKHTTGAIRDRKSVV